MQTMAQDKDLLVNCRAGSHQLVIISEIYHDPISEKVVRWCVDCGSITIDIDYDGRTQPGRIMRMRSPKISQTAT